MTALRKRIDFSLFAKKQPEKVSGGLLGGALRAVMSDSLELTEVVKLIVPGNDVFWVSNGDWSMHQLLMEILNITGPAKVYISSYAFGETPARVVAQLKNTGMITKLHCLLDDRVDVRTAGSLQILKSICDECVLVRTHAKVTVIQNNDWCVAVIGSANYTENNRYESGLITLQEPSVAMQLKWIKKALKDGTPA